MLVGLRTCGTKTVPPPHTPTCFASDDPTVGAHRCWTPNRHTAAGTCCRIDWISRFSADGPFTAGAVGHRAKDGGGASVAPNRSQLVTNRRQLD